jgi:hypothetical protein
MEKHEPSFSFLPKAEMNDSKEETLVELERLTASIESHRIVEVFSLECYCSPRSKTAQCHPQLPHHPSHLLVAIH